MKPWPRAILRNPFLRPWLVGMSMALAGHAPCAQPGAAGTPAAAKDHRRSWELNQVTWIKLVPQEKGAQPNQHPARLDPAALRQRLEGIQLVAEQGEEALFAKEELSTLMGPVCEALGLADPGEDLVLLSSHRRSLGLMSPQLGLTARLFVRGGDLNVIVRETRLDFVGRYIMNNDRPSFQYGSRMDPGPARLRGPGVRSDRGDWIVIPAVAPAVVPPVPTAAVAVAPAPAPRTSHGEAKPPDPKNLPAQRLKVLKELREANLISEEEYQQKRREILKDL